MWRHSCRHWAVATPPPRAIRAGFLCGSSRASSAPSAEEIVQQAARGALVIPGMRVYPQLLPPIRIGGSLTKALYQFHALRQQSRRTLRRLADDGGGMRGLHDGTGPVLLDVNSDLLISSPAAAGGHQARPRLPLGNHSAARSRTRFNSAYGSRRSPPLYPDQPVNFCHHGDGARIPKTAEALSLIYLRQQERGQRSPDARCALHPGSARSRSTISGKSRCDHFVQSPSRLLAGRRSTIITSLAH